MKKREELKVLHMRIRKDDLVKQEEALQFRLHSGLSEDQFTIWSVFDEPDMDPHEILKYDALVMGGSSDDPPDATILDEENYPFIKSAFPMLRLAREKKIPVFGACMGFLLTLQAFDTEIIFDYDNIEMGFYPIYLTDAGKQDPLLSGVDSGFYGVSCHKKRAKDIPEDTELLAYSDQCPIHAFKFKDAPYYAFQFHPELSDDALIKLFDAYKDRYPGGRDTLAYMERTRKSTAQANSLVRRFIDEIVCT